VVQEIGDEWLIRCPDPDHHDRNPSASVNVKKGLWTCYSCGAGGRITEYLEGVHITMDADTDEMLAELKRDLRSLDQRQDHRLPEAWLDQFDVPHDYWTQDRGLSEAICREFRLGYDWEWDTPCYPLRDDSGRVLGIIRRRLHDGQLDPDGREMPKYVYPAHADVSRCLFGYEKLRGADTLVITEGALDAIAFWEVGIPAVGQYGIMLRSHQIEMLRRLAPTSIVLAYDEDDEGLKSEDRTLWGYTDHRGRHRPPPDLDFTMVRVARWSDSEGKDPLELDPERRIEVVETARVPFG
jgi:hypothetical protein